MRSFRNFFFFIRCAIVKLSLVPNKAKIVIKPIIAWGRIRSKASNIKRPNIARMIPAEANITFRENHVFSLWIIIKIRTKVRNIIDDSITGK
ncbi:MAG: hypothetical protein ACFE8N_03095 [Promethearchaeota archaeon]